MVCQVSQALKRSISFFCATLVCLPTASERSMSVSSRFGSRYIGMWMMKLSLVAIRNASWIARAYCATPLASSSLRGPGMTILRTPQKLAYATSRLRAWRDKSATKGSSEQRSIHGLEYAMIAETKDEGNSEVSSSVKVEMTGPGSDGLAFSASVRPNS